MGRLTCVWYLRLSDLCTGIPVINLEFDPRHKSVLSLSLLLFQPVLVEHVTIYLQPGHLRTHDNTFVTPML